MNTSFDWSLLPTFLAALERGSLLGAARQLGISSRTVEIHRANMLQKLGANHTSEAIRIAIEASLIY